MSSMKLINSFKHLFLHWPLIKEIPRDEKYEIEWFLLIRHNFFRQVNVISANTISKGIELDTTEIINLFGAFNNLENSKESETSLGSVKIPLKIGEKTHDTKFQRLKMNWPMME